MADMKALTRTVIEREQAKLNQALTDYQQTMEAETNAQKELMKQEFVSRRLELEESVAKQQAIALNHANLKKRDGKLIIKQRIINNYLHELKAALETLDETKTVQFIQSILSQYSKTTELEMVLGEKTKALLQEPVDFKVAVSQEVIPNKAGFVLRTGSIEYNYLFDNLVEEKKEFLQKQLIDVVFQAE